MQIIEIKNKDGQEVLSPVIEVPTIRKNLDSNNSGTITETYANGDRYKHNLSNNTITKQPCLL